MPVPQVIGNRQDACSTTNTLFCGTGILPVQSSISILQVLKSANATTCRLTAVISIIEIMSEIIENSL